MRLICPRCGAQYHVDAAAIPASGRDVECSACDHVWRASRPAPEFDPADRPALSRDLSESIIGILREEAARELQARAAEQSGRAGPADSALTSAPLAGSGAAPGDVPRAAGTDRGRNGVTLPAAASAAASGGGSDVARLPAGAGLMQPTAPRGAPRADAPARDGIIGAVPPPGAPASPGLPPASAQPEPAMTAPPAIEPPPARRVPARPAAVHNADMPVELDNDRPSVPMPSSTATTAPHKARGGYGAGFRLAVLVAMAAVALYVLAPRLADQGVLGQRLAEWRGGVDQGRDWLATHADALMARGAD